jgi:probable rRNA maturation factor
MAVIHMIEVNNKTRSKINISLIKRIVEGFLKYYKIKESEISIAIVGDDVIKKLNKKYRGINKTTDILTFSGEDNFLGEIIINFAQIKRQAKQFSDNTEEELEFILVHGLLHLIGYDDKTERGGKKMKEQGERFIKNFKL